MKGVVWADPNKLAPAKNETLVTVPLLTEALALMGTLAGAVKVAPLAGLVMLTVGVGGGGGPAEVERVYE